MSSADSECRGCGAHVTEQFARVFGNNQNHVYGCPECCEQTELFNGVAAIQKVGP